MTTTRIAPRNHLSAKQEAFCVFYFKTGHATNSAIAAGYSPKTAYAIGSENLEKLEIQARLAELGAKAESDAIADVSERKQRLTTFIRANLVDFISPDGDPAVTADTPGHQAVSEYETTTRVDNDGNVSTRRRIKLRDPIEAIKTLNQMERIGQTDTIINNNDNRSVTIIVKSEDGKQALNQLHSGKLPQLQTQGG